MSYVCQLVVVYLQQVMGPVFEIHLDSEISEAYICRNEHGVVQLIFSPIMSIEEALATCRESLTAAVCTEFVLLFADPEVVREYETTKTSVVIRRG
jgi:hypothetical protein